MGKNQEIKERNRSREKGIGRGNRSFGRKKCVKKIMLPVCYLPPIKVRHPGVCVCMYVCVYVCVCL